MVLLLWGSFIVLEANLVTWNSRICQKQKMGGIKVRPAQGGGEHYGALYIINLESSIKSTNKVLETEDTTRMILTMERTRSSCQTRNHDQLSKFIAKFDLLATIQPVHV